MTGDVRSTSTGSGHVDARPVVCSVLLGAGTGAVGASAYVTVLGTVVVSVPDVLEQLMFVF